MNCYSPEYFDRSINSLSFTSYDDVSKAYTLSEELHNRISIIREILKCKGLEQSLSKELKQEVDTVNKLADKLKKKQEENDDVIFSLLSTSLDDQLQSGKNEEISRALNFADMHALELKVKPPKGISNIGNSCYLNSTIQALIGNEALKDAIMNRKWPGFEVMKEEAIARSASKEYFGLGPWLKEVFHIWEERGDFKADANEGIIYSMHPGEQAFIEEIYKEFSAAKRFQLSIQDFVKHLELSKKPDEMKKKAECLRAAIFDIGVFGSDIKGQQDSATLVEALLKIVGIASPYVTIREVPSLKISNEKLENLGVLPIPIKKGEKKEPIYVQNLLDQLFETSQIHDQDNAWEVDGQYHADYNETIRLGKKPLPVMVLQFKRFEGDARKREKINNDLLLPKDHILDLSMGFQEAKPHSALYRVTGSIHHGGDISGGHYRAFTDKGGRWYEMDDGNIKPRDNVDKELAESYLLILERV